MRTLTHITDRVERWAGADAVGQPLNNAAHAVIRPGPVKDQLSGSALGHPMHPALVGIPIGCWTSAALLDLTSKNSPAARRLIGLGVIFALPTALTGASDWSDTTGAEQRVGLVHAGLNLMAVASYACSWLVRRRGGGGRLLGLLGAVAATGAGYLGGHLAYSLGVGVDTNAFQTGPTSWEPVAFDSELEADNMRAVEAGRVQVLLARDGEGVVHALGNRCSHRGGPLDQGEMHDRCVVCPWHGSQFDLNDGSVRRGPATEPQPVYDVRVAGGAIEIQRAEPRSLRTNPI